MDKVLLNIAQANDIETLETRRSDSLDFHDIAVWTLKTMLVEAYEAGQKSMSNTETIREIMTHYDNRRAEWIESNGTDEGFDAWFTEKVVG